MKKQAQNRGPFKDTASKMAQRASTPGLQESKLGSFQHFAASARWSLLQGEAERRQLQEGLPSPEPEYDPCMVVPIILPCRRKGLGATVWLGGSSFLCRRKGHSATWRWELLFSVPKCEGDKDPATWNLQRQLGPT